MKTPDFLKLIKYKITGGSFYNHGLTQKELEVHKVKGEIRRIEYQDDNSSFNNRKYDGDCTVNEEKLLRITLRFPNGNGYFRWTDEKYKKLFKEIANKGHYDDSHAFDDVKYTDIYLLEEMLNKVQDMVNNGTCSYEVSYPLSFDKDFLDLAQANAEKEGLQVEQWISKCIENNHEHFKKKKL